MAQAPETEQGLILPFEGDFVDQLRTQTQRRGSFPDIAVFLEAFFIHRYLAAQTIMGGMEKLIRGWTGKELSMFTADGTIPFESLPKRYRIILGHQTKPIYTSLDYTAYGQRFLTGSNSQHLKMDLGKDLHDFDQRNFSAELILKQHVGVSLQEYVRDEGRTALVSAAGDLESLADFAQALDSFTKETANMEKHLRNRDTAVSFTHPLFPQSSG